MKTLSGKGKDLATTFKNADFRLRHSWDMMHCINDFINCIGLHKADLKSPMNIGFMKFNKDVLKKPNVNPGGVLKDYIYLEANSFFQYVKKLKKNGMDMPDLPSYLEELNIFRNRVVAHKDFDERFQSLGDWIEAQQKINQVVSTKKLIEDVNEYYEKFKKQTRLISKIK